MNKIWFKRMGWIYIPVHAFGYAVTIVAVLLMWQMAVFVDNTTYPITKEILDIFLYSTCITFWWKWVAEKTSRQRRNNRYQQ
jgi:hypothetical protein